MSRPNPLVRWAGLLAAFALSLAIAAIDRAHLRRRRVASPRSLLRLL